MIYGGKNHPCSIYNWLICWFRLSKMKLSKTIYNSTCIGFLSSCISYGNFSGLFGSWHQIQNLIIILRFVQHYIAEEVFFDMIKNLFTHCLNSSKFIVHTVHILWQQMFNFLQVFRRKIVVAFWRYYLRTYWNSSQCNNKILWQKLTNKYWW